MVIYVRQIFAKVNPKWIQSMNRQATQKHLVQLDNRSPGAGEGMEIC